MRILALLAAAALAAVEASFDVQRGTTFKGDAQDFRALSPDGRLLLAAGKRLLKPASERALPTWLPVLAVYRTADRALVTELTGPRDDYFYGGAFADGNVIVATTLHARVRWDPASPQGTWEPLPPRRQERGAPRSGCDAEPRAGYAVAPGRGIAVTVTDAPAARDQIWLEVRSYPACEPMRRLPIALPAVPMTEAFAEATALSPDGRWAAIGYGVRAGDSWGDTQAFVAIFSVEDGHRAGVVAGRRYRRHVVLEALRGGDGGPTMGVPLGGRLGFSPDGTVLYGTSERLFALDVSALR
jgi:hypothetical protein